MEPEEQKPCATRSIVGKGGGGRQTVAGRDADGGARSPRAPDGGGSTWLCARGRGRDVAAVVEAAGQGGAATRAWACLHVSGRYYSGGA